MLINCVAYQQGRKIADLQIEEISDYVSRPDCFVWVALKDPNEAELEGMREEFGLHPLAVEDASHGHQAPKVEEYGDSLFVVLRTVEATDSGELHFGEVDIFVASNYVLSVRKQTKKGFANVRQRCEREPELLKYGSSFVLYALIDTIVDSYFPIESSLTLELETIEDRIFAKQTKVRSNVEDLYLLKRKLIMLQHASSPLLQAIGKLFGGRVPQICHGMEDYYRDVYDHLSRITRSIESIREMTTTATQVNLSIIALNESEVSKKLASYGALFAVPTAIAGIYGMNFRHMPELEWTWGYPLVVCIIVLADILLLWRFRKAGWM